MTTNYKLGLVEGFLRTLLTCYTLPLKLEEHVKFILKELSKPTLETSQPVSIPGPIPMPVKPYPWDNPVIYEYVTTGYCDTQHQKELDERRSR